LDSAPVPSSVEQARYKNALNIAQQPLVVLDKIKKGTLTAEDIKTLGTLYPKMYNRIKDRLQTEMTNHLAKGETIPYKTRVSLSMFMAQPLDSTMFPASIQATQPAPQQQPGGPQEAPRGAKSSPALQKMPGMYQTNAQAKEAHRNK
jgi:hypothetical protein